MKILTLQTPDGWQAWIEPDGAFDGPTGVFHGETKREAILALHVASLVDHVLKTLQEERKP